MVLAYQLPASKVADEESGQGYLLPDCDQSISARDWSRTPIPALPFPGSAYQQSLTLSSRSRCTELDTHPATSRCHPGCYSPAIPRAVTPVSLMSSVQLEKACGGSNYGKLMKPFRQLHSRNASTLRPGEMPRPGTSLDVFRDGESRVSPCFSSAGCSSPRFSPGLDRQADSLWPGVSCEMSVEGTWAFDAWSKESRDRDSHCSLYSRHVQKLDPESSRDPQVPLDYAKDLAALAHPYALWRPELYLKIQSEAKHVNNSEAALLLNQLFTCAQRASHRALKDTLQYQVTKIDRPGVNTIRMKDVLFPTTSVTWLGRYSAQLPRTKEDSGKAVPPPLIVSDASVLDIVSKIRKTEGYKDRPIIAVAELHHFDQDGTCCLKDQWSASPSCVQIQTDFSRFLKEAQFQLNGSNVTMKQRLCSDKDPYAFLCRNVTIFRGCGEDGFPFLSEPQSCHLCAVTLWTQRPNVKNKLHESKWTTSYYFKEDYEKLLQRFDLIAHTALRAVEGLGEVSSPEDRPILVLPVIGHHTHSFHPRDAIINCFKDFRKRFSRFFDSIFVCCSDRGVRDYSMADCLDAAINSSVYRIPENDAILAKVLPWHWDERLLDLSVSGPQLFMVRRRIREADEHVGWASARDEERMRNAKLTEEKSSFGSLKTYRHKRELKEANATITQARRAGDCALDKRHDGTEFKFRSFKTVPKFEDIKDNETAAPSQTDQLQKAVRNSLTDFTIPSTLQAQFQPIEEDPSAASQIAKRSGASELELMIARSTLVVKATVSGKRMSLRDHKLSLQSKSTKTNKVPELGNDGLNEFTTIAEEECHIHCSDERQL